MSMKLFLNLRPMSKRPDYEIMFLETFHFIMLFLNKADKLFIAYAFLNGLTWAGLVVFFFTIYTRLSLNFYHLFQFIKIV